MFCPYCGTEMSENAKTCPTCHMEVAKEQIETSEVRTAPSVELEQKKTRKWPYVLFRLIKLAAFCVLAAYIYQEFQSAAASISRGGRNISYIQSVGGKTLEEAYYAELGHVYSGYATITRALGCAISGILVGIGLTK